MNDTRTFIDVLNEGNFNKIKEIYDSFCDRYLPEEYVGGLRFSQKRKI